MVAVAILYCKGARLPVCEDSWLSAFRSTFPLSLSDSTRSFYGLCLFLNNGPERIFKCMITKGR